MILFAGGWSDKRGIRKPCMLLPLFGELAALLGKFLVYMILVFQNNTHDHHISNSLFGCNRFLQSTSIGIQQCSWSTFAGHHWRCKSYANGRLQLFG